MLSRVHHPRLSFPGSPWGNKINKRHTVPCKVIGLLWLCASIRLILALRGTGIVSAHAQEATDDACGIDNCFSLSQGLHCHPGQLRQVLVSFLRPTALSP